MIQKCCLTIAGSDSGGNAGVQADLRAFHAYGVHGCTVFAALTAQNPFGVTAVHDVPPEFVREQLKAVLGVYAVGALKTGMLSSAAVIRAVVAELKNYPEIAKVFDPVMVATSGAKLIADDAAQVLADELLPLATLITPNLPEAYALLGADPAAVKTADGCSVAAARDLGVALAKRFNCAVLVKGGHGQGGDSVDVLVRAADAETFSLPRIDRPVSTHGTGCSLSAALAAELTLGHTLSEAVKGAKKYVHAAIARSYFVGENCGVLGFVPGNMI